MMYLAYTILALWAFYMGFALSISVYRQWLKGTLNLLNKVMFAPVLVCFYLLDVVLNWSVLLLVFGAPPPGCRTISERLHFYVSHPFCTTFQMDCAQFICDKLLNPIDPTGNHC
jgi:hypothetical protein